MVACSTTVTMKIDHTRGWALIGLGSVTLSHQTSFFALTKCTVFVGQTILRTQHLRWFTHLFRRVGFTRSLSTALRTSSICDGLFFVCVLDLTRLFVFFGEGDGFFFAFSINTHQAVRTLFVELARTLVCWWSTSKEKESGNKQQRKKSNQMFHGILNAKSKKQEDDQLYTLYMFGPSSC